VITSSSATIWNEFVQLSQLQSERFCLIFETNGPKEKLVYLCPHHALLGGLKSILKATVCAAEEKERADWRIRKCERVSACKLQS